MENNNNILSKTFNDMLENYKLASKNMSKEHKSSYWDVFPKDYEKAIESIGAWETFLRNPLSLGINDALVNFSNTKWKNNFPITDRLKSLPPYT